jgi:hypothetical protein
VFARAHAHVCRQSCTLPTHTMRSSANSANYASRWRGLCLASTYCRANKRYSMCLEECQESMTRTILLAGQQPATYICNALIKEDRESVSARACTTCTVQQCTIYCHAGPNTRRPWSGNVTRPNDNCAHHSTKWPTLPPTMAASIYCVCECGRVQTRTRIHACSASKDFESCWLTMTQAYCDQADAQFLIKLSDITAKSMTQMMIAGKRGRAWQLHAYVTGVCAGGASANMPPSCQHWSVSSNYTRASTDRLMMIREANEKTNATGARAPCLLLIAYLLCICTCLVWS